MNLYIKTFGCQMNVHDSQRVAEIMGTVGYNVVEDPRQAHVLVINSCTVREKAWHKAISEAGRLGVQKRHRKGLIIVVIGCVAQQDGARLYKLVPAIDLVVAPDHYGKLPQLVQQVRDEQRPVAVVGFDQGLPDDFLSVSPNAGPHPISSFVTVMKGCSERCTYCIVPSVRGPMRFRPAKDIVSDATILADEGVKEITLLGQTVNGYKDETSGLSFAGLIGQLDKIEGVSRLRFTSPHPRYMTDDLIEAFGKLPSLCESIHLPVQSGSDRILKRMGRRYKADFYREIVSKLRKARPDIMVSTDLIVGFCGETQDDFEQTIELIKDVGFSGIFSFKYSPRPGTPATKFEDDVSEEDKKRRLARVHKVIDSIVDEQRNLLIGKTFEVLVEGKGRNPGQLTGRARNSQIINFVPHESVNLDEAVGQAMNVEVIKVLPHSLEGKPA